MLIAFYIYIYIYIYKDLKTYKCMDDLHNIYNILNNTIPEKERISMKRLDNFDFLLQGLKCNASHYKLRCC